MASNESFNVPTSLNLQENHDVYLITICTVMTLLSLGAIFARLGSRRIKHVKFGIDEHLLCFAWVFGCGLSVMFASATRYARFGWHASALNKDQVTALLKSYYAVSFLQSTSLVLAKLSVLILLRRIFITSMIQITVYVLGAMVVLGWIAVVFGGAFICSPVKSLWESGSEARCGNQEIMNKISPIGWILTDFAILVCPLPVIKNLKIASGQRAGLYASFLIGALTCIVSVIRYRTLFYSRHDISWDEVPTITWSIVEVHVTIICAAVIACMPVVALFFSVLPLSGVRSIWSRVHNKTSEVSSSHRHARNGFNGVWRRFDEEPVSVALPLHNVKRTSDASSRTPDHNLYTATSSPENPVERNFDVRNGDDEFV